MQSNIFTLGDYISELERRDRASNRTIKHSGDDPTKERIPAGNERTISGDARFDSNTTRQGGNNIRG